MEARHFRRKAAGLTTVRVVGVRGGCEGPVASSTVGVAANTAAEEGSQPQWSQVATAPSSRRVVTLLDAIGATSPSRLFAADDRSAPLGTAGGNHRPIAVACFHVIGQHVELAT